MPFPLGERLKRSKEVHNILASIVRFLGRGLWALFVPIVLSIRHFGVYSIWQTTASIVAQLSILGVPQTIMRETKADLPILGITSHSMALAAIWGCGAMLLMPDQGRVLNGLVVTGAVTTVIYAIMNARAKRATRFSMVMTAEGLVGMALLLGMIALSIPRMFGENNHSGYVAVIGVEIIALLPAVLFLSTGRMKLEAREMRFRDVGRFLPSIYSIGALASLDILLWRRIEVYFLGVSPDGLQGVAVFGLATQVGNLLMLLPSAIIEAWYPSIATSYAEGRRGYREGVSQKRKRFIQVYVALLVVGLPVCLGAMKVIFAKYGAFYSYMLAIVTIRALCGFAGFYAGILYSTRREVMLYFPIILGGVVSIACNWTLTTKYGIRGALVSYTATQVLVAITTYVAWRVSESRNEEASLEGA